MIWNIMQFNYKRFICVIKLGFDSKIIKYIFIKCLKVDGPVLSHIVLHDNDKMLVLLVFSQVKS